MPFMEAYNDLGKPIPKCRWLRSMERPKKKKKESPKFICSDNQHCQTQSTRQRNHHSSTSGPMGPVFGVPDLYRNWACWAARGGNSIPNPPTQSKFQTQPANGSCRPFLFIVAMKLAFLNQLLNGSGSSQVRSCYSTRQFNPNRPIAL